MRLGIAGALALGGLAAGHVVQPDEAKAAPAVCVEVHSNPSGAPIVRWTCIGSVHAPCTIEDEFNTVGIGFSVCLDLS